MLEWAGMGWNGLEWAGIGWNGLEWLDEMSRNVCMVLAVMSRISVSCSLLCLISAQKTRKCRHQLFTLHCTVTAEKATLCTVHKVFEAGGGMTVVNYLNISLQNAPKIWWSQCICTGYTVAWTVTCTLHLEVHRTLCTLHSSVQAVLHFRHKCFSCWWLALPRARFMWGVNDHERDHNPAQCFTITSLFMLVFIICNGQLLSTCTQQALQNLKLNFNMI